MIFTDRTNFTFGGEIPQRLSGHLISNENSRQSFCRLSSSDKKIFLDNCKNISLTNEVKAYVDTMGESRNTPSQLGFGEFN